MEIPSIFPEKVAIFGGIEISETVVVAYGVTAVLIVLALIFRFAVLPRFKQVPRGFQNVIEMAVQGVTNFSVSILGKEKGQGIAPYILTIFAFIIMSGMAELLGFRSPATDLNFTLGLALMSFVLIIAYSIRYKGVVGWLKTYAQPKAFITPFNVISSIAIPISLACRMFGNFFSGLVVMDMIYSAMGYFAIALPGLASIYFVLFHLAMQSYVFTMLTMSFIKEKLE